MKNPKSPNPKPTPKLPTSARALIADFALQGITELCLNLFLSAYLYQLSAGNLLPLAIFNIFHWIAATIGAVITGSLAKHYNKLNIYRLGIFAIILYILILIMVGSRAPDLAYLLGITSGITTALHAFIHNMIVSENVPPRAQLRYTSLTHAVSSLVNIIAPVLLGAYITLESYQATLIFLLVLAILQIVVTFFFKNPRAVGQPLRLRTFRRLYRRDPVLIRLYLMEFCRGINRVGLMRVVVPVLILMQFDNDFKLGSLTSLFYIGNCLAMYLFSKFYHPRHQTRAVILSASIVVICSALLLWQVNTITIILYNLAFYIPLYIIETIGVSKLFKHSNHGDYKHKYNVEFFIFREFYINAGRLLGFSLLALVALAGATVLSLQLLFAFIGLSVIVMSGLIISLKPSHS